jgi:hypothetical protein
VTSGVGSCVNTSIPGVRGRLGIPTTGRNAGHRSNPPARPLAYGQLSAGSGGNVVCSNLALITGYILIRQPRYQTT